MPSPKPVIRNITLFISLFMLSLFAVALQNANQNDSLTPLALQGYDPISYFRSDKVQTGDNRYQQVYQGKRYIFTSEENRQMFAAHPEQFLPQFGGYCAHSATAKNPVAGDPSIYVVDEGKLFLFSSEAAKNNWPVDISSQQVSLVPLALQGFDVTTYFGENTPVKGNDLYQAVYNGKRYVFVNKENQQDFAKDPERFLPQFGGYCSHSVSQGKPVKSNPAIYIVEQDNLYLFNEEKAKNAWETQPTATRAQATNNWTFQANKRNNQIAAKNRWKKDSKVKLFSF